MEDNLATIKFSAVKVAAMEIIEERTRKALDN
jgi:hypothetical protein